MSVNNQLSFWELSNKILNMIKNVQIMIFRSMQKSHMPKSSLMNGMKVLFCLFRIWKGCGKQRFGGLRWTKAKNCIDQMSDQITIIIHFRWIDKCSWYGYRKDRVWELEANFERKNKHFYRSQIGDHWRLWQDHCDEIRKNHWGGHLFRAYG